VILGFGYARAMGLAADPAALVGRSIDVTTQLAYRGEGAELPPADATSAELRAFAKAPTRLHAQIVGVTQPAVNDNQLLVPLTWARDIASVRTTTATGTNTVDAIAKNGYTSILVQTGSSASVRTVAKAIDRMGYGTTSKQAQIDQINQLSTVMWIVLGSISLISMISAALGIVNTMLMTVSEQRYAIAVWRACGATRSVISGLFLLQAGILGAVGGVSGTAVGVWVSGRVNGKIEHLLQSQGLTSLTIDPASGVSLVAAVVLTTLLAIVAGLYPAYRAARRIEV
jgi:ABC-type antimicrobial peptide transport system permease subunit